MHRPLALHSHHHHHHHRQRWQESWARLLAPLTLWICVSVSMRYGYYGNSRMVLGPSSSRLMKASSVFVKQVEVRDDDKKEVFLYGFSDKPELNQEKNWNVSKYLIVGSYSKKGFSLWLNKGSRMQIRWEAQSSHLENLQVDITKGERKYETLLPNHTANVDALVKREPTIGKEAEYTIEEDDKYYVGIINTNKKSIIMTLKVNISSKMYDTSGAKSMCSASSGSCRLKLLFPTTQYVVVNTPNNEDISEWYIELSFVARVVTYVAILGFAVGVIFLILKYLGVCDGENNTDQFMERETPTERDPILPRKPIRLTYGTGEEDEEDGGNSSSSSEELYDGKICVICYDEQRNCFFVPCGHCATCYDCAQRIMEDESKLCPICRRLIHKVLVGVRSNGVGCDPTQVIFILVVVTLQSIIRAVR